MPALEGVRIVDFGQYVAGPLAALLLADQGADVVHVDPPGGPRWRSDADAFYNRGKRRIVLDLKSSEEQDIARRLIATSDVVIENFRPGVMERLGVGPGRMTEALPHLIYCSLPGFAGDDPRSGVAAWEGVVAAATDTYAQAGELLEPSDARMVGLEPERPIFTALPLASNFAALHAATAIVMALIARERGAGGQRIEVPLFDAMFELIGANGITLNGVAPVGRARGGGTYLCADGRRILFNSWSSPRFLRWFAEAAGVDAWAREGLLDAHRLEYEPELRRLFRQRLTALFLTRPAQEWEDVINRAGGPTSLVRTPAEWMANPHARQRGTVIQVQDPLLGPTWMAGVQAHFSASPGVMPGPRHLPDADRAQVLQELQVRQVVSTARSETQMRNALDGLRVLDLTQVVAGPCTGRILAEYGAEVIKINHSAPEYLTTAVSLSMRPMDPGNQQHEHLNRGKKTVLLDLHAADGPRALRAMIDRSDVLMQNFALGMAERYGIGYQQLRLDKPELIYFSLSAFGYGGPMESFRGYEGNAQAVTGLMDRFGGDEGPLSQPYLLDDYGTGVRGALAIGLAVYHRLRTGQGQHVNISLVETATYHQAAFVLEYAGKVHGEPRGTRALGGGPLQRLYCAADGWFFLGAAPGALLARVRGLEATAQLSGLALERELEHTFRELPIEEWVNRLREVDIGAHRTVRVAELMEDPWVRAHGLSLEQEVPGLGTMRMPGVAVRMSRTPPRVGAAANPVGADTETILDDLVLTTRMAGGPRGGGAPVTGNTSDRRPV